jgi:hypothetical protein
MVSTITWPVQKEAPCAGLHRRGRDGVLDGVLWLERSNERPVKSLPKITRYKPRGQL